MMAALYDIWKPGKEAEGEALESASILTMDSSGTPVFKVHDRTCLETQGLHPGL